MPERDGGGSVLVPRNAGVAVLKLNGLGPKSYRPPFREVRAVVMTVKGSERK
jgi:hypothetical protein